MDTIERFLRLVGDNPWPVVWLAIFVLFVLAIVSKLRAGGAVLAVLVAVIIALSALLWVRQQPTIKAPASPVQASTGEQPPKPQSQVEQASQPRPAPYGEPQEPVQVSGGLQ